MTKFEQACLLAFEDWADDIPDDLPEPEYSEKHKRWVKKLFNKMRGDRYHRFTTNTVKVMLVAAVLSALLLTAFVIPSSREYFIDNFEIFSRYKITENNKNSVNGEITVGYIPEGFELTKKEHYSKHSYFQYDSINNTCYIALYKYSSTMEVDFDTEDIDVQHITYDDTLYSYSTDLYGNSCVIWNKNDYIYKIDANLSINELIKIAKTVK